MSSIFLRQKELFSFHPALNSQVPYVYFVMHKVFFYLCIHVDPLYFHYKARMSYLWFEINMI